MPHVVAGAVLVVFVAIWLTAFLAFLAVAVYGIMAIRHVRPGLNRWGRDTLWNPANVLLSSNQLTDTGLRYRRKCFIALSIFIACICGTLLVAAITGQLR
jgi:hypothetical protein